MDAFMVVCTFKQGTQMSEVFAVVAEEQAQVARLEAEGRIGSVHLALARGTVFIEAFGEDVDDVEATIRSLPMSTWWDLDTFALGAPSTSGGR